MYLREARPRVPAPARVAAGYAAVRRLMPRAENGGGGSYAAQQAGDQVQLTHGRTGREYRFAVAVAQSDGAGLAIDVTPAGGGTAARLGLADLPERYRLPAMAALREELAGRCLTPGERALLATGAEDLPHVTTRALLRAVAALEHDASPRAIAAVTDLADLLTLEGRAIPFDVQTVFYHVRSVAPAARAAELVPVAWRLGFAEGG